MTKLLIIRHGYSEYNHLKKFTGHMDIPLTALGLEQAKCTAEYVLKTYSIDAVYSSDLCRAIETAAPVAKALGLPVIPEKRLRELDVGEWTDKYIADVVREYPEAYAAYKQGGRPTGGESLTELQTRALAIVEEIAKNHDGQTVFIATHGGFLRTLLCAWLNVPIENISELPVVSNNSVTEIDYENGNFTVVARGVDDFLADYKTVPAKNLY